MSRRPIKYGGIAEPGPSVGPSVGNSQLGARLQRMSIARVTPSGNIDTVSKQLGLLLLNPESIQENKTANWVVNQIPGASDPLLQWTGGGPRTISFDALVTRDTADFLGPQTDDPLAGLVDSAVNAIGSIASNFLGVNLPAIGDLFASTGPGPGEELSIENQLQYYRSLQYPTYAQGRLDASPPLIVLLAGKALGNVGSAPVTTISANNDLWVLTELGTRITKFLPNLTPMEAVVSFKFTQYVVAPFGANHFTSNAPEPSAPSGGSIGQIVSGFFS